MPFTMWTLLTLIILYTDACQLQFAFWCFSTMHHNRELFHLPTLMHNSLFINKCMLHYYPWHVSSINMPIFRRTNFIHTASGIVALTSVNGCTVHRLRADYLSFLCWHKLVLSALFCMFCCTRLLRYSYTVLFWCSYIGKPVLHYVIWCFFDHAS